MKESTKVIKVSDFMKKLNKLPFVLQGRDDSHFYAHIENILHDLPDIGSSEQLLSQIAVLEKALDIACIKLETLDRFYAQERNKNNTWSIKITHVNKDAEEWKDTLLEVAQYD